MSNLNGCTTITGGIPFAIWRNCRGNDAAPVGLETMAKRVMSPDTLKSSWAEPALTIGVGLSLGSMRSVEMFANTAFDFAMIDLMHGHYDLADATNAIRALLRTGPSPVARVSGISHGQINGVLDAGALGVVVPMVESINDARDAVAASYYPPLGRRSKGSLASVVHGPDYVTRANDLVSLIVMLETPEAASRATEILSVDGISACLIGASDLQFTMSVERDSEEFVAVVDQVVSAGRTNGVPVGISISDSQEVPLWRSRGMRLFLASHDLALLNVTISRFNQSFAHLKNTT